MTAGHGYGYFCQVHAVPDGCGIQVLISDLFADPGTLLLEHLDVPTAKQGRVQAIRSCSYLNEVRHHQTQPHLGRLTPRPRPL